MKFFHKKIANNPSIPSAFFLLIPKLFSHFFNPPRYLRLLEIIACNEVSIVKVEAITKFCDLNLGKEVVICNDTPGFIGNRIGTYWTLVGMIEAIKLGLTVEEADAIMGRPIGAP